MGHDIKHISHRRLQSESLKIQNPIQRWGWQIYKLHPIVCFCKALLGHRHTHLLHIIYGSLSYDGRVPYLQLKLCGLQNLFTSWPLRPMALPMGHLIMQRTSDTSWALGPCPASALLPVQATPGGVTAQLWVSRSSMPSYLARTDTTLHLSTSTTVHSGGLETRRTDQGPSRKQMATQMR